MKQSRVARDCQQLQISCIQRKAIVTPCSPVTLVPLYARWEGVGWNSIFVHSLTPLNPDL